MRRSHPQAAYVVNEPFKRTDDAQHASSLWALFLVGGDRFSALGAAMAPIWKGVWDAWGALPKSRLGGMEAKRSEEMEAAKAWKDALIEKMTSVESNRSEAKKGEEAGGLSSGDEEGGNESSSGEDESEAKRIEAKAPSLAARLNEADISTPPPSTGRRLKIHSHAGAILTLIDQSAASIVVGGTGCGKSTQVPQILLEATPSARIVVTQPRRVAAMALAARVAEERGGAVGGEVGYAVRFESKRSEATRVLFVTTGVMLRMLHARGEAKGGEGSDWTHVIIDEVHERGVETDLILATLRVRGGGVPNDMCDIFKVVFIFFFFPPHPPSEGRARRQSRFDVGDS
jgi:HrpA-like RNA helicase